jgi:heme-degrading monooxygenase HmoA
MKAGYVYVWEYLVSADHVRAFERTYGPAGDWVELFRRAPGYLKTELHRDRAQPRRFITIDYWESKEAWEAFRGSSAAEFEALDARCEAWTIRETEIGRFEPVE